MNRNRKFVALLTALLLALSACSIGALAESAPSIYSEPAFVIGMIPMAASTYAAQNFFDASSAISTNGHYQAVGVAVRADGTAFIVLKKHINTNYKEFNRVVVTGGGGSTTVNSPAQSDGLLGSPLTISLPGGSRTLTSDYGFYVVEMGAVGSLTASFTLGMYTGSGGWDIEGLSVSVPTTNYAIGKKVNAAETYAARIGEVVTYAVTVSNTGDLPLTGITVTDTIPAGLDAATIQISEDSVTWTAAAPAGGAVTLASGLSLAVGSAKTYYVKATVVGRPDIGSIVNTARISGLVIPKTDAATVTVGTADAAIKKVVAGGIPDADRLFDFTATVRDGLGNAIIIPASAQGATPAYAVASDGTITFSLKHNETVTLTDLPLGATLNAAEIAADGYTTTVQGASPAIGGGYDATIAANMNPIVFTNTRNVKDVAIAKTVSGNLGDLTRAFPFEATLVDGAGSAITLPAGAGYAVDDDGVITFSLKHGEAVTLPGIPLGAVLTVRETDANGHTATVGGSPVNADGYAITVDGNTDTISFNNHRDALIDTGVALDALPYALLLALAAAGALRLRRRRFDE
ncbi:MAG: DUF11 domain-containing protein [Clostridiales bacterium]|nr:DUF11 domain-containing protein [Clostridiales bacterium]